MTEDQTDDASEPVRTGVPAVDAVLEAVDGAADLPAEAQVAVFERAHEGLRRALDASADGPDEPDEPGEPGEPDEIA